MRRDIRIVRDDMRMQSDDKRMDRSNQHVTGAGTKAFKAKFKRTLSMQ